MNRQHEIGLMRKSTKNNRQSKLITFRETKPPLKHDKGFAGTMNSQTESIGRGEAYGRNGLVRTRGPRISPSSFGLAEMEENPIEPKTIWLGFVVYSYSMDST